MIVPMQAVAVVMPDRQRTPGLERLAKLGVVHLRQRPELNGNTASDHSLADVQSAIRILEATEAKQASLSTPPTKRSAREIARETLDLADQRDALKSQIAETELELQRLQALGDFEPGDLEQLRSGGVVLHLYRGPAAKTSDLVLDQPWQIVGREGSKIIIIATTAPPEALPAGWSRFALPREAPARLRDNLLSAREALKKTTATLHALQPQLGQLYAEAEHLENRAAFRSALATMKSSAPLTWLEGYCPEPKLAALEETAAEQGWAVVKRDIADDDEPPTTFRHHPWVESIHPIYRLISSLPGYREADVSLWFLIYLTLFFAILIGDAGYGLLMVGGALAARARLDLKGPLFILLMTLGIATTVWGAMTGNWFGVESLAQAPLLRHFVVPSLNAWEVSSQETVMAVCFVIGATHLTIAHLIVAFRQRKSLTAIAQLGWVLILWGTWFVVRFLVLETPLSKLTLPLLISGVLLVILFAVPHKNPLVRVGSGIGQLPLKLMNGFADLISYIRLFAVGMATLAVAASFNEIAGDMARSGGVISWALAGVVILFGHGINLIMAALAIVVHGVRLNMMEFSGHAELMWSGTQYAPLTWHDSDKAEG